jgi:hypothetical protein
MGQTSIIRTFYHSTSTAAGEAAKAYKPLKINVLQSFRSCPHAFPAS